MFGKNEIVGRKFFAPLEKTDQLLVTSIFVTLQGEGPFSGLPAVFVRLSRCNLACSFCDTYFEHGDHMHFSDLDATIKHEVKKFYKGIVPHWADRWPGKKRDMVLVITGGEPSLQINVSRFVAQQLETEFEDVQIESNGILLLPDLPEECYLVVSPKCEIRKATDRYLTPHVNMLERADCLKFVMSADLSSPYCTIPGWAHDWHHRTGKPVYVSPMNVYAKQPEWFGDDLAGRTKSERVSFWDFGLLDLTQNQLNHEYAAEYCIRHGLRLTLQTHLYASLP